MDLGRLIRSWPVYRQLAGPDRLGRGQAAESKRSAGLKARTETADRVVSSVCPYCAVGCAQRVYVKDEQVIQIEGNPDSPISRGRLCPKGSASKQLVTGPQREQKVLYRPPFGTEWQELDLDTAMDMVTDRCWTRGARAGRTLTRTARRCGAPWASPASAAPRWTMRKTT